jgi:hypothetical protein
LAGGWAGAQLSTCEQKWQGAVIMVTARKVMVQRASVEIKLAQYALLHIMSHNRTLPLQNQAQWLNASTNTAALYNFKIKLGDSALAQPQLANAPHTSPPSGTPSDSA